LLFAKFDVTLEAIVTSLKNYFSETIAGIESVDSLVDVRYAPLRKYPRLFTSDTLDEFLHPDFLNACATGNFGELLTSCGENEPSHGKGIYTFPLLP